LTVVALRFIIAIVVEIRDRDSINKISRQNSVI